MITFFLITATLLIAGWGVLLSRVTDDDWEQVTAAGILDNHITVRKLTKKQKELIEKLTMYKGPVFKIMHFLFVTNTEKRIAELSREAERLKDGHIAYRYVLCIPGYVLMREIEAIGKSGLRKIIYTKCFEYYGKKYASVKSAQITAKILSYPPAGIPLAIIPGVILCGLELTSIGMGLIGVGTVLVLVLVYAIYDELADLVNKRREAISRQFPGVVSKLALLVTSGMIMDRAWKETANSQDTELYAEMRKTSTELDNLVSPEIAFGDFISRCNTKETAKLASAILQNQSKGNSEIGKLLKNMAFEVWQERRHRAKRDAEKANSKLMIPTMLLFMAVMVMLMVPIAMNFSGF